MTENEDFIEQDIDRLEVLEKRKQKVIKFLDKKCVKYPKKKNG